MKGVVTDFYVTFQVTEMSETTEWITDVCVKPNNGVMSNTGVITYGGSAINFGT